MVQVAGKGRVMASFREVGGQVRAEIRRLGYYKSANFPTREAAELMAQGLRISEGFYRLWQGMWKGKRRTKAKQVV